MIELLFFHSYSPLHKKNLIGLSFHTEHTVQPLGGSIRTGADAVALKQIVLPVKQHRHYNVPRKFTNKFEPQGTQCSFPSLPIFLTNLGDLEALLHMLLAKLFACLFLKSIGSSLTEKHIDEFLSAELFKTPSYCMGFPLTT